MGNEFTRYKPFAKEGYLDGLNYTPSEPPNYGFKGQRKERVALVSEEEMRAFMIPEFFRDYCAHKYIEFYQCWEQKFPFLLACQPQRHSWQHCEYEDYVIRRKEYERERRLRERRKRLEAQSG